MVSQQDVVEYWLQQELRKDGAETSVPDDGSAETSIARLLSLKPHAASILWKHEISWDIIELDEDQFRNLRVIKGGPETDWQKSADEGAILDVAQRITRGESVEVSEDKIRDLQEEIGTEEGMGKLVLFRENPLKTPYVVDGNHRATALALHLLEDETYPGVPAFLGTGIPSLPQI